MFTWTTTTPFTMSVFQLFRAPLCVAFTHRAMFSVSSSCPLGICFHNSSAPPSLPVPSAVIDTTAFSLSSIFSEAPALDIFGDKGTSDARRRCQPESDEERELFDLHLRVAVMYAVAYGGGGAMPYCTDLAALMEERGHSLSLLEGPQTMETPWGLGEF